MGRGVGKEETRDILWSYNKQHLSIVLLEWNHRGNQLRHFENLLPEECLDSFGYDH